MSAEPKPTPVESVFAAFVVVATFALGYGYWKLATRENELDIRLEQQREEFQRALIHSECEAEARRAADAFELQMISLVSPHLAKLPDSGRESTASQRIVAAAAELLSARGRPALAQIADQIREHGRAAENPEPQPQIDPSVAAKPPSMPWLVLLATLPGTDLDVAQRVANDKLRAAKELGMMPLVRIYKTRLKGRYVVVLGKSSDRSGALAAAAEARRQNLSADACAEKDGGWDLVGTAPFPIEVGSASRD